MYEECGLQEALVALNDALDALAAVELNAEDDRAALDATVEQQRLANRLAASSFASSATWTAATPSGSTARSPLASWYRTRTRLDHGEATRRVNAANRLPDLPRLSKSFGEGVAHRLDLRVRHGCRVHLEILQLAVVGGAGTAGMRERAD